MVAAQASAITNGNTPPALKLVKPKTKRGRRFLEKKESKLVEDCKKALLLFGNQTSQVIKDVLMDLHKLKGMDSIKFSRKNDNVRPFEAGGEASLEFYCNKSDASLFALGSHSKKRPHNLVLGRLFDFHLYDCLELGVELYQGISKFNGARHAQAGNKPAIIFVGEKFESVPELRLARSLLLDFFRGLQVPSINLAGLDRVVMATATDNDQLLLRQYSIRFKRSGTPVPRVALEEMGPRMDLRVRRHRSAAPDLEKEAMRQPQLTKKKEKNVSHDLLAGKVGRIYMPKQNVDGMALAKPKGKKREVRKAKAAASDAKKRKMSGLEPAAVPAA